MEPRAELAQLIERYTGTDGTHETALANVRLIRFTRPSEPIHILQRPALCIVAGGRKRVMVGETILHYDSAKYLVASVDLPVVGQVIEASPEAPYLCLALDLDIAMLAGLVTEMYGADAVGAGLALSTVTPDLLDAAIRLLRLLAQPADIPILAPLVEREILYRLLNGEQAAQARSIAIADSRVNQVNRAIGWIRRNFAQPFSIDSVSREARMSPSTLHEHFKAVTAMSPLQYQKQIRLQEARRLILSNGIDAASAGHEVGYDSPSQFSREYRRLFGAPPMTDIAQLKARPEMLAGV